MIGQWFKGTRTVTKILLHQNGFKLGLWLFGIIGMSLVVASVYPTVYTNQEDLIGFAITMENPAMNAMLGPNYPIDKYTVGAAFANEMLLFTAIAVAVMNSLFVSSSTRNDEESGRLEYIRALPVGRLSYLAASGIIVLLANGLLFLILSVGLTIISASGMSLEASLLYGALLGTCGLFFAGLTVFIAQLADTARNTTMLSIGLVIVLYLIRAIGDVGNEALALISPLGWVVRTQVFVTNAWWPVINLLVGAGVLLIAALYLNHRRDIDTGLISSYKGKDKASAFLKTPVGLIWHLEKNILIGWTVMLFLISAAFGAILGDLETYFADVEFIEGFFSKEAGAVLLEQFIVLLMEILSIFTAIAVTSIVFKLKKEEKQQRIEHYYSRSVSRNKILFTYYMISLLFSCVIQFVIALGLYLAANQSLAAGLEWSVAFQGAFIYVPALWFILALATFLLGVWPKGSSFVWMYIALTLTVVYLGGLIDFPEWLNQLSVFYFIPKVPIETINWTELEMLIGGTVLLTVLGFIGYNRRDFKN